MLAEIVERFWNAIPFLQSRKRGLACRIPSDFSDDDDDNDDMDIHVAPTSSKRPRLDLRWVDAGDPHLCGELQGSSASWISTSKRSFSQSFFMRKVMDKVDPKFEEVPSSGQQNIEEIITIDDDDNDPVIVTEIMFVPSDSSSCQADSISQPQTLKRPPLSQRSLSGLCTKSRNVFESVEQPLVSKKANFLNYSRKTESISCPRSAPAKNYSSNSCRIFGSSRIHELPVQENSLRWSHGSSVNRSIRLDEREMYARMLKRFINNETPESIWSTSTPRQAYTNGSAKENSVTRRKSPIFKQKLDSDYASRLKERLHTRLPNEEASVLRPVQVGACEVKWLRSTKGTPGIQVIERKIAPSQSRIGLTPVAAKPEIEVLLSSFPEPKPEPKERYKLLENPLLDSQYTKDTWLPSIKNRYRSWDEARNKEIQLVKATTEKLGKERDTELQAKIKNITRLQEIQLIDEEVEEEEVQEIEKLVELTPEMTNKIKAALHPTPPNEVLVEAFNLKITRRDMETLNRDNWLNDEVINFYFTLIAERGKLDNYLSVHVCNTFFYPKLVSNGHASLKRWTRKTDIFAHDLMLVPVHLGVHWCLAVVDFRQKKIRYYDSMSGENNKCLMALKGYLEAESLDKKKVKLDTSDWVFEIVKDKPNQLNGSDCGMFACKYAEYLSRDAKITFTQEDMPYFRRRMVYEILTARLL